MIFTGTYEMQESCITLPSKAIHYIVEAAHTAGWQEATGLIEIENDEELTKFLLNIYNKWVYGGENKSFTEFSTYEIFNRFKKSDI